MPHRGKARLDQALLKKIAEKTGKSLQYVREQTSRRASRLSITSEAAQVLWAKELEIGTGYALRRLDPHIQEQVQASLPSVFARADRRETKTRRSRDLPRSDSVGMAAEYLLSDRELRDRCQDLLKRRRHSDRVLREATTVLEDRIKKLSGLTGNINPEPLVNQALNPDLAKAVLQVSKEANEQAGFHSICRGIVLAFRHKAHHQLDDKVTREDALKFCGFVDVLLEILGKATRRSGP